MFFSIDVWIGRASVQRGAQDGVVPGGGHGDLLHHLVAPAERRRPVRFVQRPDGHGQELPRGHARLIIPFTGVSASPLVSSCALSCPFQAWCVAGNCFSLQREHDIAIKFFQRAIQVSPRRRGYGCLMGSWKQKWSSRPNRLQLLMSLTGPNITLSLAAICTRRNPRVPAMIAHFDRFFSRLSEYLVL